MKTASFGFEADLMSGGYVAAQFPVQRPIVLRGYQISLGLMVWNVPIVGNRWTEVLYQCWLSGAEQSDFGPIAYQDHPKDAAQNLHGNQIGAGSICRAIVKGYAGDTSAVNVPLSLMGMDLQVPESSSILMRADHAGWPADFECQAVFFYD